MNKKRAASHQDFLDKKEAKGKWSLYWAILDGTYLLFYESKKSQKLFGSIQIGSNTRCIVTKRKTYSFPFMVCAAHGRHLFKCESGNRRHQWMAAIQEVVQLLRLSSPPILIETDQKPNDLVTTDEAPESHSTDRNQEHVLPSNVLLVTSFPATSDSPSLPFRIQDRRDHSKRDAVKGEQSHTSSKSPVTVYPFARKSEESPRNISASEREQISTLNLSSHTSLCERSLLWATDPDSLFSPRNRSFPTTPEKGSRPFTMSPQTLSAPMLGKSKSLNSLPSSDSLSSISGSHMRFSRHMVSGNDVGDMDV